MVGPGIFDASQGGKMVFGHHGACSGFNDCGEMDLANGDPPGTGCAQMACEFYGYAMVVNFEVINHSVGGGCTDDQVWNLFYDNGTLDENWMSGNCNSCNLDGWISCARTVLKEAASRIRARTVVRATSSKTIFITAHAKASFPDLTVRRKTTLVTLIPVRMGEHVLRKDPKSTSANARVDSSVISANSHHLVIPTHARMVGPVLDKTTAPSSANAWAVT